MKPEIVRRGKFKTEEPGREYECDGGCLGIDRFRAGKRGGANLRESNNLKQRKRS